MSNNHSGTDEEGHQADKDNFAFHNSIVFDYAGLIANITPK